MAVVKKKKKFWSDIWVKGPINYNLFFAILFLCVFGLIMIYSASYYSATNMGFSSAYYVQRQGIFAAVGILAMLFVSRINYHFWVKIGFVGYPLAVLLLLMLIPFGHGAKGAVRWIRLGPVQFQAAEPVKLFLMVFFAWYVKKIGFNIRKYRMLAWFLALVIALMLLFISDNMSTAVIVLGICYVMFLVSKKKCKSYLISIAAAVVFVALALLVIEFVVPVSPNENFRITRIRAFMHPDQYAASQGLQAQQALYAIGAGGFWGKGLGQSLVKFKLSEPYTDYILAIICEELGVFGGCLLLFLFGYLVVQIVKIARNACDIEGKIFCVGVFAQISVQTILNVMVVANWFPTTGVTLPFISYGGASVVFLLIEFGVVFNIDNVAKNKKYRHEAIEEIQKEEERRKRYQYGK